MSAIAKTCPLCKGKGRPVSIDALLPDGSVINPRPAVCMVCDGVGTITDESDAILRVRPPTDREVEILARILAASRFGDDKQWAELKDEARGIVADHLEYAATDR